MRTDAVEALLDLSPPNSGSSRGFDCSPAYHQHQRDEHDSHGYLNNYTNVLKIESYPRLSDRSHPISGTWTVSTFPNPTSRR